MTAESNSIPPDAMNVLVASDLAETGDLAVQEGLRFSQRHPSCRLHVIHVIDGGPFEGSHVELDRLEEELRKRPSFLRNRVAMVMRDSGLTPEAEQHVTLHVRVGEAAETIRQCAVDVEADLIVVGTHHRQGMQRLLLGSVAESVLRAARCPVLVAMPKNYEGLEKTERMAAPYPEGQAPKYQRHRETHVYTPNDVLEKARQYSQHPTGVRIV